MNGTAVNREAAGAAPRAHARPFVLLTTDYKPSVGGIAELLHQLAEGTGQSAITVVYSSVDPGRVRWTHAYEVRRLPAPPTRNLGGQPGDGVPLLRKLQTARFYRSLARAGEALVDRVLSEVPVDAEVSVGQWTMETDAWCEALTRRGRPYTLFAYGLEVARPLSRYLSLRRRTAFRDAACVYAISRGTADLLRNRLGCDSNVRLIRLGIDVENAGVIDAGRVAALRNQLAPAQTTLLLTVGRLVRRKGVDLVLEALASLCSELPDLRYAIAGSGPELDSLRSLAASLGLADRVHFLGAVDEETKRALYSACDVFVMPNRLLGGEDFEGFGLVFLEAALAGKPSIGGANGGVPDAVIDGETGLLVDPERPGAVANAIRRLSADPAFARRLSDAARARVQREHGLLAVWRAFAAARDGVIR